MSLQTFLPFLPRFIPLIESGAKTCTARSKCYGEPGDTIQSNAGALQFTAVFKIRLRHVKWLHWMNEGVASPEEFEAVWREIHPRTGFNPDKMVWLHQFRKFVR